MRKNDGIKPVTSSKLVDSLKVTEESLRLLAHTDPNACNDFKQTSLFFYTNPAKQFSTIGWHEECRGSAFPYASISKRYQCKLSEKGSLSLIVRVGGTMLDI